MGTVNIAVFGDVVGRPGRETLARHLGEFRRRYKLDAVIINGENLSHGYGLTRKHAEEMTALGVDVITGGNHSFDKKEIVELFDTYPVIRPVNLPADAPGKGVYRTQVGGYPFAVVNVMGHFGMPMVDNPFTAALQTIETLRQEGYKHIVVDMHAEATAEKYVLLHLLKDNVSAILGTHTHVGTDDLQIIHGCAYVTDIGLTGCRDGVIGMDKEVPMRRALTAVGGHMDVPKTCKTVAQAIVVELHPDGRCASAYKVKLYDDETHHVTLAFREGL